MYCNIIQNARFGRMLLRISFFRHCMLALYTHDSRIVIKYDTDIIDAENPWQRKI